MKTLRLFFKFQFTSLSPDAQPISLGIVSEEIKTGVILVSEDLKNKDESIEDFGERVRNEKLGKLFPSIKSKSLYAEFSDFQLERCDDWVKENVIKKLEMNHCSDRLMLNIDKWDSDDIIDNNWCIKGEIHNIKQHLLKWLTLFSDYQIEFVCDCGSKDWEWMLQLIAEWDYIITKQESKKLHEFFGSKTISIGLPKLPSNISPVPMDLNNIIAIKKGITIKYAFELDRQILSGITSGILTIDADIPQEVVDKFIKDWNNFSRVVVSTEIKKGPWFHFINNKYNALWDATVIKSIYQKLI